MAGEAGININLDTLSSAKSVIDPLIDDYKTSYEAIYSAVTTMKESYQGSDSDAFVTQIEQFKNDFEKLETLLRAYSDEIEHIRSEYAKVQEDLKNRAANLNAGV